MANKIDWWKIYDEMKQDKPKRFVKIKKEGCYKCGADCEWIATPKDEWMELNGKVVKGWEVAHCVDKKCGVKMHFQFMCQGNVCEWHEHCKKCGSELCMACYDGECYTCANIFEDQGDAQMATMFGSKYIVGW